MKRTLRRTLVVSCTVTALVLSLGASAWAAGFAAARFGGERGNPTEPNPTSLYYNPAGIAFSDGTNIWLDINWVFREASYERPRYAVGPQRVEGELEERAIDANSGEATLSNFLYSPSLSVSHHLGRGTGVPLAFGVGVFFPFGGQAVWDQRSGFEDEFPGASDGPQRWFTIDGSIRTMALTFGAAYQIEPIRLGIGVAANLYLSDINTIRARELGARDQILAPNGTVREGRALIDASATDIGLGVGVLWEPVEDELWLGFSYQSRPGFDGEQEFTGTFTEVLGMGGRNENDIRMTQQLPDIFRFGMRFRPAPNWEIRNFYDYTRWGNFSQQCVVTESSLGDNDLYDFCRQRIDGSLVDSDLDTSFILTSVQRRWQDTIGVRLGASWWNPSGDLEVLFGAGYDGSAVPDATLEPALIDAPKWSLTLGGRYQFTDWFGMSLTATNIFFQERDTRREAFAPLFEQPSRQPSSAGIYNQNFFLVNTGFEFSF